MAPGKESRGARQARPGHDPDGGRVSPKTISRPTVVELKQAIYKHHGWRRAAGESMSARVNVLYEVTADHRKSCFVATPRAVPERSRTSSKKEG